MQGASVCKYRVACEKRGQRCMNMQAGPGKRTSGKCDHREAMERVLVAVCARVCECGKAQRRRAWVSACLSVNTGRLGKKG